MTYDDWKLETPEDEQLRFETETRGLDAPPVWSAGLVGARPGRGAGSPHGPLRRVQG